MTGCRGVGDLVGRPRARAPCNVLAAAFSVFRAEVLNTEAFFHANDASRRCRPLSCGRDPGRASKVQRIHGIPKVVDGDTIQFGDVRLHLEGIDAPQTDQACFDKTGTRWKCGVAASDQLKSLAGSKSWACKIDRKDIFGRQLAKCQAGGEDIARQMVGGGWALASTTGVATYLPSEEVEARASGAGTLGRRLHRAAGLASAQLAREDLRKKAGSTAFRCPIAVFGVWRFAAFSGLRDQGQCQLEREMHISQAGRSLVQAHHDGSEVWRSLVLHCHRGDCLRMP